MYLHTQKKYSNYNNDEKNQRFYNLLRIIGQLIIVSAICININVQNDNYSLCITSVCFHSNCHINQSFKFIVFCQGIFLTN